METFNALSSEEKLYVLKDADYIVTISKERYYITLYLVNGLFDEKYYRMETGECAKITAATDDELEKYLDCISITHLL